MYRFIKGLDGSLNKEIVVRLSDNASIPCVEGNRDYQEYLGWVAEGNTAEEWTGE
jgi:hypothetical protein